MKKVKTLSKKDGKKKPKLSASTEKRKSKLSSSALKKKVLDKRKLSPAPNSMYKIAINWIERFFKGRIPLSLIFWLQFQLKKLRTYLLGGERTMFRFYLEYRRSSFNMVLLKHGFLSKTGIFQCPIFPFTTVTLLL